MVVEEIFYRITKERGKHIVSIEGENYIHKFFKIKASTHVSFKSIEERENNPIHHRTEKFDDYFPC